MIDTNELRSLTEDNCIIILDTNCFLELYRYSASSSRAVEYVLEELRDRIWIPHHTYTEYLDNHHKVKREQYNKYRVIEKNLKNEADKMLSNVNNHFKQYKKYGYPNSVKYTEPEIIEKVEEIKAILTDLGKVLEPDDEQNKNMLKNDMPLNFIESLKKIHQIGEPFTTSEKIEIYKEGEIRYKLKIPPGYKDSNKSDHSKENDSIKVYGDLVIWKSILKYAKENVGLNNIIFLTNDTKSDWWEVSDNKSDLSPRKELLQEFKEYSNCEFRMYSLNDFVSTYADHDKLTKKAIIELEASKMIMQFFENNDFNDYVEIDENQVLKLFHSDVFDIGILFCKYQHINISYVEIEDNKVKSIGDVELVVYANVAKKAYINDREVVTGTKQKAIYLNGIVEVDFYIQEFPEYVKSNYYIDQCFRLEFPVLNLINCENLLNTDDRYGSQDLYNSDDI